jgi:hypothetical protein
VYAHDQMDSELGVDYPTAWMLRACLSNGFTTLRDVGGGLRHHKQAVNDWLIPGPRLFISGPLLSQTGGHGKYNPSVLYCSQVWRLTGVGDHGDRDTLPRSGMISKSHLGVSGNTPMAIIVDGGGSELGLSLDCGA